jgi:hypothetical protein
MMMKNEPQSEPLDFPSDAMERLLAAFNDANDAFRAYFQAWNVNTNGQNAFELTENKELFKVARDKQEEYFQSGMKKMLAAAKPAGGVQ